MNNSGTIGKWVSSAAFALVLSACGGGGSNPTTANPQAVDNTDTSLSSQAAAVNATPVVLADASSMKTYTHDVMQPRKFIYEMHNDTERVGDGKTKIEGLWISSIRHTPAPNGLYLETQSPESMGTGINTAGITLYITKFEIGHRYRLSLDYQNYDGAPGTMRAMVLVTDTHDDMPIAASEKLVAIEKSQHLDLDFVPHERNVARTASGFEFFVRLKMEPNSKILLTKISIEEIDADPDAPSADVAGISKTRTVAMPPTMFGVLVNNYGNHSLSPNLGHSILRLWDGSNSHWAAIQPLDPALVGLDQSWKWLNPNGTDANVVRYMDYAANIAKKDVLLELGVTPAWASSDPTHNCGHGTFGIGGCKAPKSIESWKTYVRTVLTHFRDRYAVAGDPTYRSPIKYLEIWNEFSVPNHFASPYSQLAEMTCAARDVVNEEAFKVGGKPIVKIVAPSLAGDDLWKMREMLEAQTAEVTPRTVGECADIFATHIYLTGYAPEIVSTPRVANLQLLLKSLHLENKPLWNTEGSSTCDLHCPAGYVPSAGQAKGMLPRMFATMWANGISNFDYFLMEGGAEPWMALVSLPGTPESTAGALTPMGMGYATAVNWFKGATLQAAYRTGPQRSASAPLPIHVQKIEQSSKKLTYMVWSDVDVNFSKVSAPAAWKAQRVQRADGTITVLPTPTTSFALKAREPVLLTP